MTALEQRTSGGRAGIGAPPPQFVRRVAANALLLCGLAWLQAAQAGAGLERLDRFFADLRGLQADFTQSVSDTEAALIQRSAGVLYIMRPGKFRWDYRTPYEQLIVADGRRLWIYDPDLDQVTVKPLDDTLGSTPALLLSSDQPLEAAFVITELGARNGLEWLQLEPRQPDTGFLHLRLAFDRATLRLMELVDGFGQTTEIRFDNLRRNPALAADLFRFVPPARSDVIGDTD